jgi:hypothetical protein
VSKVVAIVMGGLGSRDAMYQSLVSTNRSLTSESLVTNENRAAIALRITDYISTGIHPYSVDEAKNR